MPYGIYDLAANAGWVNVGIDNDTAAFAVQTIRRWWQDVGRVRYPLARRLVITADGGGSNGTRVRLWKLELQRLADELGISIEVHHLPPGTSKSNKIEHLVSRSLPKIGGPNRCSAIAYRRTDRRHDHRTGLTVRCELDAKTYRKGIVVSDGGCTTFMRFWRLGCARFCAAGEVGGHGPFAKAKEPFLRGFLKLRMALPATTRSAGFSAC